MTDKTSLYTCSCCLKVFPAPPSWINCFGQAFCYECANGECDDTYLRWHDANCPLNDHTICFAHLDIPVESDCDDRP